jgi:hypothetical protein
VGVHEVREEERSTIAVSAQFFEQGSHEIASVRVAYAYQVLFCKTTGDTKVATQEAG